MFWKLIIFALIISRSQAVVWRADLPEVQQTPKAEMLQVGKVFFSPLKVFGSSCVSLGGKWVLTCRHGTDKWKPNMLKVTFPHLDKVEHPVSRILFPPKGDFALLELKKKIPGAKAPSLYFKKVTKNQRVWIGGFGMAGPIGKVNRRGKFHAGHNRVDGFRNDKISISLSKLTDKDIEKEEAILALFDSGSPLFVQTPKGWQLAGIGSSATSRLKPSYGDRAGYARVSKVAQWIQQALKAKHD